MCVETVLASFIRYFNSCYLVSVMASKEIIGDDDDDSLVVV